MSEPMKKLNLTSPESYSPKKPEILNMMKNAAKNEQSQSLPSEFMNVPKDKIAAFSGERWPYSNVTSAFYAVVGLFYGRTENRNNSGELVNDDKEYSIQNVLTGEAFGLFYPPSEHPLSMAVYGFTPCHLEKDDYSAQELVTVVKDQIYRGNAVFISKNSIPRAYFIWGYKEDGNVLAGCEFEHGNDGMNCSYDFDNPKVFDSWTNDITGVTFFQPDGEKIEREVVYRKALANGYRMLTETEPPPEMDFATVHRGYGQSIYDEWIRQLEQANAENSEAFYFASPIFPHFIALYENRLHLYKFLKIYAEMHGDENLHKAAGLCEQLKELAVEAAQIGYENEYSKPEILAMTNNERRSLLIDLLKKCRNLELEVAGCIKMFLDMPESYSPKKPEILNMVENMKEQGEAKMEILVKQLNDDFSIVECKEKQIIGVRMVCPPLARLNSIDIVRRSILEGTCSLLEKLAGNKNPGQYIAVMCDIRTGVDFTYIIGVEVDDGTVLPDLLPPDTVMLTIPAATFGKRRKKSDESANNALSSFSYSDFRRDMNYSYSDSSYPFSYYNADAEMLYTYQPVKQPQSDEEKYDSVSYEVVTLPDIKIIAKSGDNGECMWNFFKEMNTAEQTESAKLHLGNLVAFGGKNIKGEHGAYFGSRVTHFEDTPNGFEEAVYPSKLFVRMYQKQTNNDNASILFDGGKDYFFKMHPEYEVDYADGFYDLFIFQYEQGVEVYVPIIKK